MQNNDRKLVWAALIIFAIIALELAWFLFIGPINQSANGTANQESDYWEWVTSAAFWTAIFTGVLTWSTIRLWRETRRLAEGAESQAEDTKKSLAIAKQAAEAASLNAQAAIGAEAARLVPVQFYLGQTSSMFTHDIYGDAPEPSIIDLITGGHIVLQFKNIGRTSAEITAISVNIRTGENLPGVSQYPARKQLTPTETCERDKLWVSYCFDWEHPNSEDAKKISAFGNRLWLFGYVEYIDFMGSRMREKFCSYLGPRGLLGPPDKNFRISGPIHYFGTERITGYD